ncbi:MAG: hypothetical protein HY356_05225 [Gammaproteobacteria bacterium]|nr:hypothetical protein [Gammaproteobacteria bacterium]
MSEVEQLEQHIQNLSTEDLAKFRAWFTDFDSHTWDEQIATDLKAGKLDLLISEALAEHKAGKTREL